MKNTKDQLVFERLLLARALAHPSGLKRLFHFRAERFESGGKRYRFNQFSNWVVGNVINLVESNWKANSVFWLLKLRPVIRGIQYLNQTALLNHIIENTRCPASLRIVIWLRGRCKGSLGTKEIAKHLNSPDFKIRKEIARALQRMHGWAELRYLNENDPSQRIRNMAIQARIQSFDSRSNSFFERSVTAKKVSPQILITHVNKSVDLKFGLPPKNPSMIRSALERIMRVVTPRIS